MRKVMLPINYIKPTTLYLLCCMWLCVCVFLTRQPRDAYCRVCIFAVMVIGKISFKLRRKKLVAKKRVITNFFISSAPCRRSGTDTIFQPPSYYPIIKKRSIFKLVVLPFFLAQYCTHSKPGVCTSCLLMQLGPGNVQLLFLILTCYWWNIHVFF